MHGWLSATLDLLFHAYLLAMSRSGRHERTTVCTLLLRAGPIKGCSAVLAVRTVDTGAVAFGAWFVCAQKKSKFKNKTKNFVVVCSELMIQLLWLSPRRAPPQPSQAPARGWHSPVPWLGLRRATPVSRTCHAHKNTHARASCSCWYDAAVLLPLVVVLLLLPLLPT